MNDDALFAKGAELREQLFRLRFKSALGNTDTIKAIQDARKEIARVKTELRSREIAAEREAGTARKRVASRAARKKQAERRMRGAAHGSARA
jgi:large subunit ribosomal protein L29